MSVLFSWIDYTLFIIMLLMSTVIGVYYGFFKKQSSVKEYLFGGKNMNVWPISLSLVSSCISGIPLLTFPTDIYSYGITLGLNTLNISIIMLFTYFVYMPVFYKLQVTSMYEYFELRFDKKMRILASVLYTIYMALYLPVVIYVPSLVLAQVTGTSVRVLTPILCGICIFYTTVGGLKAVVWTDALQFIFMIGSMIVVAVVGINNAGGFTNVWRTASNNGRLDINFDFDITLRDTFWSGTIGLLFLWFNIIPLNQGTVQKCMSLSSYRSVKRAITISSITLTLLLLFVFFTGLGMYAKYFNCDPLTSEKIERIDQLLPFYVMDVSQNLPGLPGLFMAGILSAALSTLSAGMNCLATTIYEDFMKPFLNKDISEKKISLLLKVLVIIIGVICCGLVYAVEQLGSLLSLTISLFGVAGGPIIGIFTVGMMIPMVNSISAFISGIISLCLMTWVILGAQFHRKEHPYLTLPVSTAGCIENANFTSVINATLPVKSNDDGFFLYRISHNYYSLMGLLLVVILSVTISSFTRRKNKIIPRECITPFMQFLLPKSDSYLSVEEAVKLAEKNSFQ